MGPCVAYCLYSRVGSVAVAVPARTICFAPHTSKGALPLAWLLGPYFYPRDASFVQQEYETLVATINRHLSAVQTTPVAIDNDAQPSVFTNIAPRSKKSRLTQNEHDALLKEQRIAVHTANFRRGDRWLSTGSVDASSVRPVVAYVSGDPLDDVTNTTTEILFTSSISAGVGALVWVLPGLVLAVLPVLFVYIALKLWIAWMTEEADSDVLALMWRAMLLLLLIGVVVALSVLETNVRSVVRMEVSPSRRYWKVQRSLGRPVMRQCSGAKLGSFANLKDYVMCWTQTVAQGSLDELLGCEV